MTICKDNEQDSFAKKVTVLSEMHVRHQFNCGSALRYPGRKSICRERPMKQASGSDLQPCEDGGDALLPRELRADHKPRTIPELYGRYTQIYHDQWISGDV